MFGIIAILEIESCLQPCDLNCASSMSLAKEESRPPGKITEKAAQAQEDLRQDPLDLSFWSFLTFLHHGIEEVKRHLL